MEKQQAIQAIRQFFDDKTQKSILLEYKDIITNAKKEGMKDEIDIIGKMYDTTNHLLLKQSQILKVQQHLQSLDLASDDTNISDVVQDLAGILSQFDNFDSVETTDDVITLKKDTDKQLKAWEKSLNKTGIDKSSKNFCEHTLAIKFKANDMEKNTHIIELLKVKNPSISHLIVTKKQDLMDKFEPSLWIAECAKNAGNVSLKKTHISKLTHSSASSVNINAIDYQKNSVKQADNTAYLTTSEVINPSYDFAYSSAGFASIADFLRTPCSSSTVGEAICEDVEVLYPFSTDESQAQEWQESIKLAFSEKQFLSHELLKQVYFPVNQGTNQNINKGSYHLLCPLMSSSLAQAIDDRIWSTRQKDMPARIARKNKTYCDKPDISYLNTAKIHVTQSNHQNVSNLNGKRNGRLTLLSSAPPNITNKDKNKAHSFNISYHLHGNSVFNDKLSYRMRVPLMQLRKMLFAIQNKELEQNLQRKKHIIKLVESLVSVVMADIEKIQDYLAMNHEHNQDDIVFKLKPYEQYWLFNGFDDETWLKAKEATNWEKEVAEAFAKWINGSLSTKAKKLSLGTEYRQQWQKILTPLLRVSIAQTESMYSQQQFINQEKLTNQEQG